MEKFDVIIIGGGPGGYTAALKAAELGKKALLFEQGELGGTCLNRGCIPTKALLHAAHAYEQAKNMHELGITLNNLNYDAEKMFLRVNSVVTSLRSGIEGLLKRAKVTVIRSKAYIETSDTVTADGTQYKADNILIAAGSEPLSPPIDGINADNIHTSDFFLQNAVHCDRLLIVGGGVIGVEFATIYSALGCEVTVIEGKSRLLPQLEQEVGRSVAMQFKKGGIAVHTDTLVTKFTQENGAVTYEYKDKDGNINTGSAQKVLVCVGRKPCTKALFAPDLGIEIEGGYIVADKSAKTGLDNIYAIGDAVLGSTQLAHAAEAEGINAVCAMFGHAPQKDTALIPSCVFTRPEIATVGLDADTAKEQKIDVVVTKNLTSANGRSVVEGAQRGFVKLVAHKQTGKLLGATLMCEHAGEMIGGVAAAINAQLTAEQYVATVFPHPTVSETITAL